MKRIHCSLLVVGLTVSWVLDSDSDQRYLYVVELWGGVKAVVYAAKAGGFTALPFDKFRTPGVTDTDDPDTTEDMLLEAGFRRTLCLALRLRRGGLLWMAPVCSSWVCGTSGSIRGRKSEVPSFVVSAHTSQSEKDTKWLRWQHSFLGCCISWCACCGREPSRQYDIQL